MRLQSNTINPAAGGMLKEEFEKLLETGIRHGASDIHFRPGAPPMYRVEGVLSPLKHGALKPAQTRAIAEFILGDSVGEDYFDKLLEHDTSYSIPGVSRFRVNIYRQRGSLALVLRIIPPEVPTIESLELPSVVRTLADSERGLILVTGATGAGKTSTLAAMVDHINRTRNTHILTIEDPLEFLHRNIKASISQREIGMDTGDYTSGLRAALRQDPDVILVGEMRETESFSIAMKASETGHLILSTVHTTDATKTINRLISMFPPEEQQSVRHRIAENLTGVISQRLVPRADRRGRCAAMEVLIATPTVREIIMDIDRLGELREVMESGRARYGMQTFDQHLHDLYRKEVISVETALSAATSPADFQRALTFD